MYNFQVTHASANEASDGLSGSEAESYRATVFPNSFLKHTRRKQR